MNTEIESSFRIYVKNWFVETRGTKEEVEILMRAVFEGRLLPLEIEMKFEEWSEGWVGRTYRWSMNSEWKSEKLARKWEENLQQLGDVTKLVARNSKQEHELINYGVVMLPQNKD